MVSENFRKTLNLWLPVLVWASVIFYFSSQPQKHVSEFFLADFLVKKAAHVGEFAILFVLIYRATGKKIPLSFLLTILYAASDEFHQTFVPGRTPKLYDIIGFDITGANIASYALWKLSQRAKTKQKN